MKVSHLQKIGLFIFAALFMIPLCSARAAPTIRRRPHHQFSCCAFTKRSTAEISVLTSFRCHNFPEKDIVEIRCTDQISPQISIIPEEDAWFIDLIGVSVPPALENSEALGDALILTYGATIKKDPPIFRIYLYAKPGSELKLVKAHNGFDLFVARNNQRKRDIQRLAAKKAGDSLFVPEAPPSSVHIALLKEKRETIAKYLASCAGKEIQFTGNYSGKTTFEGQFKSFNEAFQALAAQENWAITDLGDKIVVKDKNRKTL